MTLSRRSVLATGATAILVGLSATAGGDAAKAEGPAATRRTVTVNDGTSSAISRPAPERRLC